MPYGGHRRGNNRHDQDDARPDKPKPYALPSAGNKDWLVVFALDLFQ